MKNTTHTVYIDMDGVLCNYVKGVCKVFEFDYDNFIGKMTPGEYDLSKHPFFIDMKFENDMIDTAIQDDIFFWSELEPYPEAKELVDFIDDNFEHWYICTTPKNYPECYAGKVQWLHDQFTIDFDQIIMIQDKSQLAGRNRILIDDCNQNIEEFREFDGLAYRWFRKWNCTKWSNNKTDVRLLLFYNWLSEIEKIPNINSSTVEPQNDLILSAIIGTLDVISDRLDRLENIH